MSSLSKNHSQVKKSSWGLVNEVLCTVKRLELYEAGGQVFHACSGTWTKAPSAEPLASANPRMKSSSPLPAWFCYGASSEPKTSS